MKSLNLIKEQVLSLPFLQQQIADQRVRYWLLFGLQVALVLTAYPVLHDLYFDLAHLPQRAYFEPVVFPQFFSRPVELLAQFFVLIVLLGLGYRSLGWQNFEQSRTLKSFILFLVIILAWTFSTYDYNPYYNQPHYPDRFILLGLAGLVWINPVFLPLFLIQAIALVFQFDYPLEKYSWTDKEIIFNILILFNLCLFLKLLFKKAILIPFIFLALCLFAANYYTSGVEKLEMDWLNNDRIYDLVVAGYVNGWLGFLSEQVVLRAVDFLKPFDYAMLLVTLIIEVGALFILFHKRGALLLLGAFALLHLMIFATSGILFWKWILLAFGLMLVLHRLERPASRFLFTWPLFLLSVLIIYFSSDYFDPVDLAWYDTNLNNNFELEAVGESGTVYEVARNFMAPYDLRFAQNRLEFLTNEKLLVKTYGTTSNIDVVTALRGVKSETGLTALEAAMGRNSYNERKSRRFDYFIQTYFGNLNRRGEKEIGLSYLSGPQHIWNFARNNAYQMQEDVRQVRVRLIKTLYDGQALQIVSNDVIRTIDIPAEGLADFDNGLTLLDCDPFLDMSNAAGNELELTCYWWPRVDLDPAAFEIVTTLRKAATGQIVRRWQIPLEPARPPGLWGDFELIDRKYSIEGDIPLQGRYHLDVSVHGRDSHRAEQAESELFRIENIQDEINVRTQ